QLGFRSDGIRTIRREALPQRKIRRGGLSKRPLDMLFGRKGWASQRPPLHGEWIDSPVADSPIAHAEKTVAYRILPTVFPGCAGSTRIEPRNSFGEIGMLANLRH